MLQILQWIGGIFYLLNKIFFSLKEHALYNGNETKAQKWKIIAWSVYLIGLPAWVIIFIKEHNWIAASVETSGTPAMVLGLVTALRGKGKDPPRWLDQLALVCIPIGFAYSLYDFGGINTINQWLETTLVIGFLVGTYMLAKERAGGYLWYVLMHISCGCLMWRENYQWLFWQQVASLIFIIDAYNTQRKRRSKHATS